MNETPKRGFCGTFARVELHDLVESGELSATAAWLTMMIEPLSKGKRKCFASNAYLAKKLHKSERQIQVLLSKLEEAHLLKSKFVGRERQLWIDWTFQSNRKREKTYKAKSRPVKNSVSEETRYDKNSVSDTKNLTYRIDKPFPNGKGNKKVPACPNGQERDSPHPFFKNEPSPFRKELQLARKLLDGLSAKIELPANVRPCKKRSREQIVDEWAKTLRRFSNDYEVELEVFAKWINVHIERIAEDRWPKKKCMRTFCESVISGQFDTCLEVKQSIEKSNEEDTTSNFW